MPKEHRNDGGLLQVLPFFYLTKKPFDGSCFSFAYIFASFLFRLYVASPVVKETVATLCVVPSPPGENGFTL